MQISKIGSDAVSLGWWSCAALSRLKGMDGETRGGDSRKTRNCKIKPRMGLGMHWGKRKISEFYILGNFVPFHLQEKRKSCNCRGVKWKKPWERIWVMAGEDERRNVGFKGSFVLQGVEIHLGHEQKCIWSTPVWLNFCLGENISPGATFIPLFSWLGSAPVSRAETELPRQRFRKWGIS